MKPIKKNVAGEAVKVGARGVLGVLSFLLKAIGTLLLILVTTGVIFACIFVIYIKTNLTTQMDVALEDFSLNQTSVIYYMDSETGTYKELTDVKTEENRTWISYSEISQDLEHAVVSIEDRRFYDHDGVDWYRTIAAFFNMFLSMRDTFGGSTLTQQLIKNLTTDDDTTVTRKLVEIFRALEFERNYSKEEIMEWYLNVVYFGHSRYGIGAAADYYFDKSVSELTLAEIASIIGITNNPSLYDPMYYPNNNKERQENILYQMYSQGYISYDDYEDAKNENLNFTFGTSKDSFDDSGIYSYFVDAVVEDVINDLMEVKDCTYEVASRLLSTGGYKIYTTMDPDVQAIVDSVYQNLDNFQLTSGSGQQFQSAIVITDPYTGNIVALSGGVGEKTISRGFNRATQMQRPAGSSFKPIAVYAPGMEYGYISPNTKVDDSEDAELEGSSWMPNNDDLDYDGIVTIREAVIKSINTVSAQVLDMLSPQASYDFLTQKLGFKTLIEYRDGISDIDYAPLSLGQLTDGVTVREMATAYGIFPNDGMFIETRTYTLITDADDNVVFENVPESRAAISSPVAYWMTQILSDAAHYGTGYESALDSMPSAGKTGTTNDKCDRWFCGFTPYYVAAVWTGYDTPERISASGNPAARLWKQVMELVHANLEYKDFYVPENTYIPAVPGVEAVNFTIRCVDTEGNVIYEFTEEKVVGYELEVEAPLLADAPVLKDYTLISAGMVNFTVTEFPDQNVVEFIYQSKLPPSPSPEPSTEPSTVPSPSPEPSSPAPQPESEE